MRKPTFGAVRGEIVIEDDAHPLTDALVMMDGTTVGFELTYRALGTGAFELDGLPPDDYRIMIRGPELRGPKRS